MLRLIVFLFAGKPQAKPKIGDVFLHENVIKGSDHNSLILWPIVIDSYKQTLFKVASIDGFREVRFRFVISDRLAVCNVEDNSSPALVSVSVQEVISDKGLMRT